jgi:midasin (ATPase involved in ribosome maturation)
MPALIQPSSHADIYKAIREAKLRSWLLCGPPGVGKTSLCFQVAQLLKWQTWKVQFHSEMAPAEVLGMYVPAETGFDWMDGPLAEAYAHPKGSLLILDEIIEASGPCKTLLYGALDDGPGGTISYAGMRFEPSPNYHVGATMNGWPYEGGLRSVARPIRRDVRIPRPGPKQLETLDKDLRLICEESYTSTKNDPMEGPDITFRMLKALQKLRKVLPLEQAALAACHGNQTIAYKLAEVLELAGEDDEDDEDDEEDGM